MFIALIKNDYTQSLDLFCVHMDISNLSMTTCVFFQLNSDTWVLHDTDAPLEEHKRRGCLVVAPLIEMLLVKKQLRGNMETKKSF